MDSQDLKSHQWKNRIVLVLSQDENLPEFSEQIEGLKSVSKGCAERKLIMYQVVPNEVHSNHFDGSNSKKWTSQTELYKEFMEKNNKFKIVLIGLDGTVKEERSNPISSKELFEIIDGMSMRQAEMRKN